MPARFQPVEVDGNHFVDVIIDGKPKRYGPYHDESEAHVMAAKFAGVYSVFKTGGLAEAPEEAPTVKRRVG